MGNKSSRPRSATSGPTRAAQPSQSPQPARAVPPSAAGRPASAPNNGDQRRDASTAAMIVAAVHGSSTPQNHRPRSSTAAAAPAAAVVEVVVYTEASFAKHPATHRPSGRVYPLKNCRWQPDVLASMVTARAIAPFGEPFDDPATPTGQQMEECPLCMLYYATGLNTCFACHQGLCSECFASLMDPPATRPTVGCGSKCPFCNVAPFKPTFTGPKSVEQLKKLRDEADEMQRLERAQLEAAIADEHARLERKRLGLPPLPPAGAVAAASSTPPPNVGGTSPPPAGGAASPSPPRQRSSTPLQERNPDHELFDLPSDLRLLIVTEEFRQRLVTYYRHRRPEGLTNVDEIVRRYGPERQDAVLAAAITKYGDMPPIEECRKDVAVRLAAYHKSKKGTMTLAEATALAERFGDFPWKAMARAVVERGKETQPAPLPVTASSSGIRSPTSANGLSITAAAAAPAAPRPAALVISKGPVESIRQTIISLVRVRRPTLLAGVLATFAANPDTRLTETHTAVVAHECAVEDVREIWSDIRDDVALRLRHYFATSMPERQDADELLAKYRDREALLMAGIVLKYGPEPGAGAPLSPASQLLLDREGPAASAVLVSSQFLATILTIDDLDPELASALRASVDSL